MSFKASTSDQEKTLIRRCTVMSGSIINNSRSLFCSEKRPLQAIKDLYKLKPELFKTPPIILLDVTIKHSNPARLK